MTLVRARAWDVFCGIIFLINLILRSDLLHTMQMAQKKIPMNRMMGNGFWGLFSKWRHHVAYRKMTIVWAWDVFYGIFLFQTLFRPSPYYADGSEKKIPMNRMMENGFLGLDIWGAHFVPRHASLVYSTPSLSRESTSFIKLSSALSRPTRLAIVNVTQSRRIQR